MNCVYCKYNDGTVYTSIPPKYRCTITNEFHLALDDCNVEFAPVRHGRWKDIEHAPDGLLYVTCSVCGKRQTIEATNYCPNCGARMHSKE